ncbi:MAGa3780 family membrane protein [Mycoplasma nasistruthionis]|uniref:Uncharacterized protein n=1 Tax=Mycoplasma nasistruthionis TaxID=353852 RepID=A0A4Y6I6I7_9MOLU|nr:hypothetical protein [Mycoplasma nasistruthionis]QCZ36559.1 hypothetical protein FG904_00810 [Mycoplasma nasistruthionis]QDF64857.1 hypothetical protein FIV53_00825 [Mycoplasma nasistruthionis]
MKLFLRNFLFFNKIDWYCFSIGVILLLTYLITTILEWHFRSVKVYEAFESVSKVIESANIDSSVKETYIYPNATEIFWGGSTKWFTFISNLTMAISLATFPFYKNSYRAQKFYFGSLVYIIITVLVYWSGVAVYDGIFTNQNIFEMVKTLIMHAFAPALGLSTFFWLRHYVKISNNAIWFLAIYPVSYFFFTLIIYFTGHKFMDFGGTELDRGVVIYKVVSFYEPLGYNGGDTFIVVLLDIILFLMAFLTAPIIGFCLRKFFRVLQPNQKALQPFYFVHPDLKNKLHLHLQSLKHHAINSQEEGFFDEQ